MEEMNQDMELNSRVRLGMVFSLLSVAVLMLDQATKYLANLLLSHEQAVTLLPVLDLQLLHDADGQQHMLFSVAAMIAIVVWMTRRPVRTAYVFLGLALIMGGAAGNLMDRLISGHAIDFIWLHWRDHGLPIFNVADVALSVGVLMLLLDLACYVSVPGES